MSRLSISQAWRETLVFLRAERRLLLPLVLATVALPSAILELSVPAVAIGGSGTKPLLPEPGPWVVPAILLIMVMLVGELAVSRLALGWDGDLKSALRHALKRFPALIGANMLFGLALLVPFILLMSLVAAIGEKSPGGGLLAALLIGIPLLILLVRAAFALAVAAAEAGSPLHVLRRSFMLTIGESWRLLGFVLLFVVAALTLAAAISAVGGGLILLVLGKAEPWTVSAALIAMLGGVVQGAVALLWVTMLTRCYAQLATNRG